MNDLKRNPDLTAITVDVLAEFKIKGPNSSGPLHLPSFLNSGPPRDYSPGKYEKIGDALEQMVKDGLLTEHGSLTDRGRQRVWGE